MHLFGRGHTARASEICKRVPHCVYLIVVFAPLSERQELSPEVLQPWRVCREPNIIALPDCESGTGPQFLALPGGDTLDARDSELFQPFNGRLPCGGFFHDNGGLRCLRVGFGKGNDRQGCIPDTDVTAELRHKVVVFTLASPQLSHGKVSGRLRAQGAVNGKNHLVEARREYVIHLSKVRILKHPPFFGIRPELIL